MRGLADREDDVVRELRQEQQVAHVGVERLLEHRAGLARGDQDQRRARLLADRGDLACRERRRASGVDDAVEVPAGEGRSGLRDVLRLADELDLGVACELLTERREAVAVADQVDADALAHRTPPVRTELRLSMRSGLSAALIAGRSSSVQSAFFRT